jgi:hypothetical protein
MGKTDGSGQVDTELLKQDMLPDDGDRGHAHTDVNSQLDNTGNFIETDTAHYRNNAIILGP